MDLVYVAVGGLIGILGGLTTTCLSHRLVRTKSQRQELVSAYTDWSGRLHHALEEWKNLALYDHVEQLKRKSTQLRDISSSPSGRTREDIVRNKLTAFNELESTCCRLLLLEPLDEYANRVLQISEIKITADPGRLPEVFLKYVDSKKVDVRALMRDLQSKHPLLRKRMATWAGDAKGIS